MRHRLTGLAILAGIMLVAPAAFASPLSEKQFETAFTFSYVDTDDFGKTTNLQGDWQWIFKNGYHEVGALLSYLNIDFDGGGSEDAMILGPMYTFNWFPEKKITGYLSAAYGFVSGDLGDSYDDAWQGALGAKLFVGDSAAIRMEYFIQKLDGDNGISDQDNSGLRVGISIFAGSKK